MTIASTAKGFENFQWKNADGNYMSFEDYGSGWYPVYGSVDAWKIFDETFNGFQLVENILVSQKTLS